MNIDVDIKIDPIKIKIDQSEEIHGELSKSKGKKGDKQKSNMLNKDFGYQDNDENQKFTKEATFGRRSTKVEHFENLMDEVGKED
eukprot:CAMPEP_0116895734 /NCGR_PEP_ID=MMETSP0467-20121206/5177_1 /TAXON_ID=283647 /ORGANISM="Mesodinium pulex, Strain SPMC105" /LENGTH=84 /DNA_ID=CAMNT_0004566599 /DNA_START=1387 /DNA_END=1641 /DNA_ORIENTATION=-